MRERKNIKLRVDMNEDTKFKIIDRKPERDLIYCIWIKLLLLAGKVNKEGELHLSKSIPYTIDTLAIEFNRDIEQVKLALDVFLELEMIEVVKHNVYKVKNFAKHQNIKVNEENADIDHAEDRNKVVDNGGYIENNIEAENKSVGKYIKDDNKVLNNEKLIVNEEEIKIDTKNTINEEVENTIKQEKEGIKMTGNDIKISKNKINDSINVDKNILTVNKRKRSNSKTNNTIFKDGFQDVKEKYISETWDGIGCFKEQEGDEVIMKFDVS